MLSSLDGTPAVALDDTSTVPGAVSSSRDVSPFLAESSALTTFLGAAAAAAGAEGELESERVEGKEASADLILLTRTSLRPALHTTAKED